MRHRRTIDRALTTVVGLVVCTAVYLGADLAGGDKKPEDPRFERAQALHEGVDPLRPPGLPSGARVDPDSGNLTGIDLQPAAGEQALEWYTLLPANKAGRAEELPARIRALDGKRVVMAGFQYAIYSVRDMREFLLVASHYTCCFGRPAGLAEQVIVRLAKSVPGMEPTMAPIRVRGTLRLKPQHLYPSGRGRLISLFELTEAEAIPYDG